MSTVSAGPRLGNEHARLFFQQRFHRLFEQAARLAEMDLTPAEFHHHFLQAVQAGTGATAVAFWTQSPAGVLQPAYQINLDQVGLGPGADNGFGHDALLVQTLESARPVILPPNGAAVASSDPAGPGNPTDTILLLAPVVIRQKAVALLEVWLDAATTPDLQAAFLQFLIGMAHHAAIYLRNQQLQAITGRQTIWDRLQGFSQRVHDSLDLSAVAYTVANEGRELIACDRLTVARRCACRARIEAISGVDRVEPRATQVQLLGRLCEHVLNWGEVVVYRGVRDDTLPPLVLQALDTYLAHSPCQLLTVLPLRAGTARPQFVLVAECFELSDAAEPLLDRLELVGRHARTALDNAAAYHRIPLRWLWRRLLELQDGLGGPAVLWTGLIATLVVALCVALWTVPWPLKMAATGQLLPRERRWLYPPVEGQVVRFEPGVQPGALIVEGQSLVLLYDAQLEGKLVSLANEVAAAQEEVAALTAQLAGARSDTERLAYGAERKQKEYIRNRKQAELKALRERTHADDARPGYFWLKAPLRGTVLNWDFRERLTNRHVKPTEPLLRLGDKDRGWEVELKISHRHIAWVLDALAAERDGELEVDLLLVSSPTQTFTGKLSRQRLAAEAAPDRDGDSAEPVVRAAVRIDGPDIPEGQRIPAHLLVSGSEVHARVRCGDRPMIYSLFHGVWEFICEKVLFF